MIRAKIYLAIFTLALAVAWFMPGGMRAQEMNMAALVVRHSGTSVETKCVEFAEEEITGLELLQRSGLDFGVDVQGLGALVCRIDQTGCSTEDCWCQCKGGGDCVYWSYWHQISSVWQYSQAGAAVYTIRDGDVDGWSWGPGAVNAAFPPPDLSFEDICSDAAGNGNNNTPTNTPAAIIFVPQNTPESNSNKVPPTQTPTELPTATVSTIPPTVASTSPAPTKTMAPTATAAVVAEALPAAEILPLPATPTRLTQIPTPGVDPVAAEKSSPVVTDVVAGIADVQPTPQAIAKAAEIEPTLVQQGQEEMPAAVGEKALEPTPRLTVVGSGAQVKDLRVQKSAVAGQSATADPASVSNSPLSYAIFGAIMLVLVGLYAFSSTRRKERQGARGEPRSRV